MSKMIRVTDCWNCIHGQHADECDQLNEPIPADVGIHPDCPLESVPDVKQMVDHLENIRRSAERGINLALEADAQFTDLFQHILDHYSYIKALEGEK